MFFLFSLLCFLQVAGFCSQEQSDHEMIFTQIYDEAMWGTNGEGIGFSGGGSLPQNVVFYMDFVQNFMKDRNIKTVVDVGCGDWTFSKYMNWDGIEYVGYDVVQHVIERNQAKYSSENIRFVHSSFLSTDLPVADLLLCKHVLQHLTNADIMGFLKQLPKFKYCLITNQIDRKTLTGDNLDIPIGGCHKLELRDPPFNLKCAGVCVYEADHGAHQILFIDQSDSMKSPSLYPRGRAM